jgi:hypothetical protein
MGAYSIFCVNFGVVCQLLKLAALMNVFLTKDYCLIENLFVIYIAQQNVAV